MRINSCTAAVIALLAVAVTAATELRTRVVRRLPHDTTAYTEGLVMHAGALWESTGLYGRSQLRRIDAATGSVTLTRDLPTSVFGEGLSGVPGEPHLLVQLTWRQHRAFTFDTSGGQAPRLVATTDYALDGWGATHDGEWLITSDGTNRLHFVHPRTLAVAHSIEAKSPDLQLNELEYIDGLIYAAVWHSTEIVAVDPRTGEVRHTLHTVSASGLPPNGIAWDAATRRMYVTGKHWPEVLQLQLLD